VAFTVRLVLTLKKSLGAAFPRHLITVTSPQNVGKEATQQSHFQTLNHVNDLLS